MLKLVFNGRKLMELHGWGIYLAVFGWKETAQNGGELYRWYHFIEDILESIFVLDSYIAASLML